MLQRLRAKPERGAPQNDIPAFGLRTNEARNKLMPYMTGALQVTGLLPDIINIITASLGEKGTVAIMKSFAMRCMQRNRCGNQACFRFAGFNTMSPHFACQRFAGFEST